jgi:hypothetical protein
MKSSSQSERIGRTQAVRLSAVTLTASVAVLFFGAAAAAGATLSPAQQRY